ncbi:MAG: acyl-CoA dehydrogenase family protein [Solobacterium sp.]|nr:acyl-CoA dehydrogenase family protein [Solobacterium sp.]
MWYMNEERELLRKSFREYTEKRIRPLARKLEAEEENSREALLEMGKLGMFTMPVPEAAGGTGPDYISWGLLLEELGKEGATFAFLALLRQVFNGPMQAACSKEQIEKYVKPAVNGEFLIGLAANEPAGGNNMFEYQTKAVRDGDDWIINGSKVLVTQASEVDVFLVLALTRDQIDFRTMEGIDIFFVPTSDPGFRAGHIEHKVGLNGSNTGSVYFDNIRVPESDRLPFPMALLMGFGPELSGYAAIALGGAEAMIAKTADYLKNRIQMGVSLWDAHESARHDLAKLQMEVYNYRNSLYGHLANRNCGIHDMLEAGALKASAGPLLEKVAGECMMLMGGTGVIRETGIEQYWRDAKALEIACFSDKTFTGNVAASL